MEAEREGVIISGLPNHLALLILARLPFSLRHRLLCVSHAWHRACTQQPCPLHAIRKELNICEVWPVFISFCPCSFCFIMIDPALNGVHREVYRPLPPGCNVNYNDRFYDFYEFPPVAIDQSSEILVAIEKEANMHGVLHKFDTLTMDWKTPATDPPLTVEYDFANAASGAYVYAVGGFKYVKRDHYETVKSAKRLDTCTMKWEALPDMIDHRASATGLMLHGCFCVIGGRDLHRPQIYSGEIWDPVNQEWTLVPELWPCPIPSPEGFNYIGSEQYVRFAVVNDRLYALVPSDEIVYYEDATKEWISLGPITGTELHGKEIYGVGNELWLHCDDADGHSYPYIIMSTVPTLSKPLEWKIVKPSFEVDELYMPVFVHL